MALIELKDLSKDYSDGIETPALSKISCSIEKGEFIAIMGPSGSGKSTLLHLLGFLDSPSSGKYILDGRDASSYSKEDIARLRNEKMGFIFQSFNLLPQASVLENVLLPLQYSTTPETEWVNRARSAIKAVGLSHREDYKTNKLSGGEKQRVAIARALINNPQVIFADEPTGNLDSKSGGTVMEILSSLNQKGHTIILVTHETYTAEHAGRIIRLMDGHLESDKKVTNRRTIESGFIK